jgi:hypothetical protein
MSIGDFHRHLGRFAWNGTDYVFVAEPDGREWIVDFGKELRGHAPPLDERLVVEGYRLDKSWLLVERVMPLGEFEKPDRAPTLWQRLMG